MTYHIHFSNIDDGKCSLEMNGEPADMVTRRNRCLQVIFTLEAAERAELTVDWKSKDRFEVIRERILKCFIQLPLDNWYKEMQWEAAKEIRTFSGWLQWIESLQLCRTGKQMLMERLNAVRI